MTRPIATKFLAMARDLKSGGHDAPSGSATPTPEKPAAETPKALPSIEQVADGLIKRFDQNTDLEVSASELSAVLNPKGKFDLVDKMIGNLLTKLDTTKDGALDKSEWTSALKGLDKNADGALSRGDLQHGPDALIALVGILPHHEPPPGG